MVMKLSPKTRRNLIRTIPYSIIWLVSTYVFGFVEEFIRGGMPNDSTGTTEIVANFSVYIFATLSTMGVGFLIGAIELFLLEKLFRKNSFIGKTVYKTFFYLAISLIIMAILYPIAASLELNKPIFHPLVMDKINGFFFSYTFYNTLLQMSFSIILCVIYAGISENLGHSVMVNFFTGKYHKPKEESRIFMFLDMTSSTVIAEKLGHIRYFDFLKQYYNDLSDAIILHFGEVYQYIGDEIVITWPLKKGVKEGHCVKCFFTMREELQKKEGFYKGKFEVTPGFKAGLHCGEVTTGEIGALKKEIFFTGDVLNTAARIQELCKLYQKDLLVSGVLVSQLPRLDGVSFAEIGTVNLQGKENAMKIFSVSKVR